MRLTLLAVGHMQGKNEAPLFDIYTHRITTQGAAIGFSAFEHIEIRDKGGKWEKSLIDAINNLKRAQNNIRFVFLHEQARQMTSSAFADFLRCEADNGLTQLCFVIGGADGFSDAVRAKADMHLSLGQMTWPHMLARIMLVEQIWRAISILTNHPYHRG